MSKPHEILENYEKALDMVQVDEETTTDPDDSNEELKAPVKIVEQKVEQPKIEPKAQEHEKEYHCAKCGKKFEPLIYEKDGKTTTASAKRCYEFSLKKYGEALCKECAKQKNVEKLEEDLKNLNVQKGVCNNE